MCRDEAYEVIRSLEAYVKAAKLRSSNYATTFALPTLVKQTDAEARRIIHGVDQLFRKIGGEQHDQVDWRNGSSCYLTKSDQFLRLLHNYIGNFMKSFEVNNVELEYPWLVRYTENIFRDAPSQFNLYSMWVHKYLDKGYGLRKSEIVQAHESYKPYYPDLVIDLVATSGTADNTDRMSTWERKTVKSSSSGKTSTESKPDKGPNDGANNRSGDKIPPREDSSRNRVSQSGTFMGNNPVVSQHTQQTIASSGLNLSVFNESSPFKISEISDKVNEEEELIIKRYMEILKEVLGYQTWVRVVGYYRANRLLRRFRFGTYHQRNLRLIKAVMHLETFWFRREKMT
jgi:hypothetical protein